MKNKPVTLKQTCFAFPAQWEGHLNDGKMYYARYRFGQFSLSISLNPTNDVMDAVSANAVLREIIDDWADGYMETEKMMELTGEFMDWDMIKKNMKNLKRA